MKLSRIEELRIELYNEEISYGELAEIESAFELAGIPLEEGMLAGDMLDALEGVVVREDIVGRATDLLMGEMEYPVEEYARQYAKAFLPMFAEVWDSAYSYGNVEGGCGLDPTPNPYKS